MYGDRENDIIPEPSEPTAQLRIVRRLEGSENVEPSAALLAVSQVPADRHPAAVYLARLSPGTR